MVGRVGAVAGRRDLHPLDRDQPRRGQPGLRQQPTQRHISITVQTSAGQDKRRFPTSLTIPPLTYEFVLGAAWEVVQDHFRIAIRELRSDTVLVVKVVRLSRGPIVIDITR